MRRRLIVGVSMAATMNERVHENRNENLHGRKKIKHSFRADKHQLRTLANFEAP
jgi:hypothetical protein